MKFCTSDTHFFHDNLLGTNKFAPRPFNNVNEMNQTIINNWNDKVGENDIVYHLGDIALYFTKFQFHDVGVLLKYNHRQYYLTHYPLMLGIAPQIINLHGHIHHYSVPIKENINIGVDAPELDYLENKPKFGAPLNFHEIEEIVAQKAMKYPGQK